MLANMSSLSYRDCAQKEVAISPPDQGVIGEKCEIKKSIFVNFLGSQILLIRQENGSQMAFDKNLTKMISSILL